MQIGNDTALYCDFALVVVSEVVVMLRASVRYVESPVVWDLCALVTMGRNVTLYKAEVPFDISRREVRLWSFR